MHSSDAGATGSAPPPRCIQDDENQAPAHGGPQAHAKGKKKRKSGALRASGLAGLKFDPRLLDGEFDPEEWDKVMAAAFDDEYYVG